ncbi:hypothetical protein D1872_287840 [compost metagenome]
MKPILIRSAIVSGFSGYFLSTKVLPPLLTSLPNVTETLWPSCVTPSATGLAMLSCLPAFLARLRARESASSAVRRMLVSIHLSWTSLWRTMTGFEGSVKAISSTWESIISGYTGP